MVTFSLLHLCEYRKEAGRQDPLKPLEQLRPLKLSSCMRHVYLFEKNEKTLAALKCFLSKREASYFVKSYDILHDDEAYQFLLFWLIGGLNPKQLFSDTRIIGVVRAIWNQVCYEAASQPLKEQLLKHQYLKKAYEKLMVPLFEDVSFLGKIIPHVKEEERDSKLKLACERCGQLREQGILTLIMKKVDPSCFVKEPSLFRAAIITQLYGLCMAQHKSFTYHQQKESGELKSLLSASSYFNRTHQLKRLMAYYIAVEAKEALMSRNVVSF